MNLLREVEGEQLDIEDRMLVKNIDMILRVQWRHTS